MSAWSPAHYLQFADERGRAARDLLANVPLDNPAGVVDLGCGPGNSTELLAGRFPDAALLGVDSSAEMLADARKRLPQASFIEADVARWAPGGSVDLIYANALFQWVPDHLSVLARLLETLPAGGVLAVQVPDNFEEPSHRLMAEIAEDAKWRDRLMDAEAARDPIPAPSEYYNRLALLSSRIEIWHTVYNHVLDGAGAIARFFGSTGLRPYLAPLDDVERAAFLAEYERRAAIAYPALTDGRVLLRFPRLFVVAVRA